MKKIGVFAVLFLIIFSVALVVADSGNNSVINSTVNGANSVDNGGSSNKIDNGFRCLEKMAGDCSKLTTSDLAMTILATPDNIFDSCVSELEKRENSNNWGNIKDTALAILALKHAGKDTSASENWLLDHEQNPKKLIWYIQEDSNNKTKCNIAYGGNDYTVNIGTNKKIDSGAGTCLNLAQSNFWLKISPNCYDNNFTIGCDKDFIVNLLYKNSQSTTIYVLGGTDSSPAFGSVNLNVMSKCFGTSGSCNYEATEWATLALLQTGHDVKNFIPYLVASSEMNERYLPNAFIYILTNYNDYATQLIEGQKLGNYWEADNSANDKFYDTSLSLISLGDSSSEQVTKAKSWLLFSQGTNGCWHNSVKDTAMSLWALARKTGRSSNQNSKQIAYCSKSDYFCIPSSDCPTSENVGNNYFCPSLSDICCTAENLKNCSAYDGQKCNSNEICTGNEKKSSDVENCCTGSCQEKPQETECKTAGNNCMNQCSDYQTEISEYSCNSGQVCCGTKTTTPKKTTSSHWWIWVLMVLILITVGAIAYVYREKLKLMWFKSKTKFKKDEGGSSRGGHHPGFPSRPGFPPIRRSRPPAARMRTIQSPQDSAMKETFRKLNEMSR